MACKILDQKELEALKRFMEMLKRDAQYSIAAKLCLDRLSKLYIF